MEQRVHDYLDDPYVIGVSPELADQIEAMLVQYGDEALRQIGLFCLGKWFAVHTGIIEELSKTERFAAAMSATMDATRITDAIALLESVGSFGGEDDWKAMLHETFVGAVNDAMNEMGEP